MFFIGDLLLSLGFRGNVEVVNRPIPTHFLRTLGMLTAELVVFQHTVDVLHDDAGVGSTFLNAPHHRDPHPAVALTHQLLHQLLEVIILGELAGFIHGTLAMLYKAVVILEQQLGVMQALILDGLSVPLRFVLELFNGCFRCHPYDLLHHFRGNCDVLVFLCHV